MLAAEIAPLSIQTEPVSDDESRQLVAIEDLADEEGGFVRMNFRKMHKVDQILKQKYPLLRYLLISSLSYIPASSVKSKRSFLTFYRRAFYCEMVLCMTSCAAIYALRGPSYLSFFSRTFLVFSHVLGFGITSLTDTKKYTTQLTRMLMVSDILEKEHYRKTLHVMSVLPLLATAVIVPIVWAVYLPRALDDWYRLHDEVWIRMFSYVHGVLWILLLVPLSLVIFNSPLASWLLLETHVVDIQNVFSKQFLHLVSHEGEEPRLEKEPHGDDNQSKKPDRCSSSHRLSVHSALRHHVSDELSVVNAERDMYRAALRSIEDAQKRLDRSADIFKWLLVFVIGIGTSVVIGLFLSFFAFEVRR